MHYIFIHGGWSISCITKSSSQCGLSLSNVKIRTHLIGPLTWQQGNNKKRFIYGKAIYYRVHAQTPKCNFLMKDIRWLLVLTTVFHSTDVLTYGGIILPSSCKINHVNMPNNTVHMRLTYIDMRDYHVNMLLKLCCMLT